MNEKKKSENELHPFLSGTMTSEELEQAIKNLKALTDQLVEMRRLRKLEEDLRKPK